MNEEKMIFKAIERGLKKKDIRQHKLGAVGIRSDGAIVTSYNGSVREGKFPPAHAEARLARKLTPNSVVYVARSNNSGDWRLARPCNACLNLLRNKQVTKVIYTIKDEEYGTIWL